MDFKSGNVACRDIVQFVPFRKFGGDATLLVSKLLELLGLFFDPPLGKGNLGRNSNPDHW